MDKGTRYGLVGRNFDGSRFTDWYAVIYTGRGTIVWSVVCETGEDAERALQDSNEDYIRVRN